MDFWARLIGAYATPKNPAARPVASDSHARLARFRRLFSTILDLCNRPRNPTSEGPLLSNLSKCVEKIAAILREETRAPVPHSCLQFAANNQIYAVIARAATASQNEPLIKSTVAVFSALVDSEEEDFLASAPFAKTLMRLVTKVVDAGNVLVRIDTETAILELLFTIAAKIRLQPEILPVWFQSASRSAPSNRPEQEKLKFVGITQKNDFPLCYLLIDRVHHEGRIGDFARTGLLYVFEVTGRSKTLEEWVVSSDLPTLMASGLGALYSQLNRELSILHHDATLPAVLAMSDYSTTHSRPSAESAFSDRHKAHMATFLSYLAFWQDVLDHCRSMEVKHTLLDHFQVLFLQQLLYPSILQSSDTDAGSSVAVLTYMCAMLEKLDDTLIHNMLIYLLAIQDQSDTSDAATAAFDQIPATGPRSTSGVERRQSLMLLNGPRDIFDTVEPVLFNLVDLIINNISSTNSQAVYSALRLASTLIGRQKKYCFGTLLKVQKTRSSKPSQSRGLLAFELEQYLDIAASIHPQPWLDTTYAALCDDVRLVIESQLPSKVPKAVQSARDAEPGSYTLPSDDPLLQATCGLMRSFLSNSVDVNLALTQIIVAIAVCPAIRLQGWAVRGLPPTVASTRDESAQGRSWQSHLDTEEREAWEELKAASLPPRVDPIDTLPLLQQVLRDLQTELDQIRSSIPNIDHLISSRQNMLQIAGRDGIGEPPSLTNISPSIPSEDTANAVEGHSRKVSAVDSTENKAAKENTSEDSQLPNTGFTLNKKNARRPGLSEPSGLPSNSAPSKTTASYSIFRPPPPDSPSTTDVLMQTISFSDLDGDITVHPSRLVKQGQQETNPNSQDNPDDIDEPSTRSRTSVTPDRAPRTASLNHVLTNIIILHEFLLEITAILQVRAALLGDFDGL